MKTKIKNIALYSFYFVIVLIVTGWFCQSAQTSSLYGIIIVSVCSFVLMNILKLKFENVNRLLLLFPFLLYYTLVYLVSAIFQNALLAPLIMAVLGLYINILVFFKFTVGLGVSLYITFIGFSNQNVKSFKEILPMHNIRDFTFLNHQNIDTTIISSNKCYVLETFGYGCGRCIHAVVDLEDYLIELEKTYKINIEHVYVGRDQDIQKTIEWINKYSNPSKECIYTMNNNYYNTTKMKGFPYFVFYDKNGDYLTSFSGYFKMHKKGYIRKFNKIINCNCKIESS